MDIALRFFRNGTQFAEWEFGRQLINGLNGQRHTHAEELNCPAWNYERLRKERSPRMILNCRLSPKDSLRQNESVGKTGSLAVAKSTLPVRGKLMRRPDLFAMPDFRRNLTTGRVSTRRWNQGLSETGSCDGRSKTSLTTHTVVEIQEFVDAGGIVVSDKWLLFTKFCRQGPRIGSLIPSSRWIAREMLKGIDFSDARCIVELGADTGPVTAELLQHAVAKCKTVIVERDPARLESNSSL